MFQYRYIRKHKRHQCLLWILSSFCPADIPITKLKEEIKTTNVHPVQRFIQERPWEDWMLGKMVYARYKEWCEENGITAVANTLFKTNSGGLIEDKKISAGITYKIK
jgi:hypothetical protein